MNNRRTLSIDTSSRFCLQVRTKPNSISTKWAFFSHAIRYLYFFLHFSQTLLLLLLLFLASIGMRRRRIFSHFQVKLSDCLLIAELLFRIGTPNQENAAETKTLPQVNVFPVNVRKSGDQKKKRENQSRIRIVELKLANVRDQHTNSSHFFII